MAGIIRVSEADKWSAANWAYWSLMDYLIDAFARTPAAAHQVEQYKWMQTIDFPLLRDINPEFAMSVFTTLEVVAERCATGNLLCKVEGRVLDEFSQSQYREAMSELVSMLYKNRPGK